MFHNELKNQETFNKYKKMSHKLQVIITDLMMYYKSSQHAVLLAELLEVANDSDHLKKALINANREEIK